MIDSKLSTLMGSKRLKVIDVAREIEVNRSSIDKLYNNQAKRIDLETLDKLCKFLDCTPNDILNFTNEDK
ncbi:helix-turn-helix transcriptional regulator [Thiomicrorhabdus sp. Kp2]|uniref:helix-turn-helix domain-containing protein n=1 Tax=Thiomicrorhabdus sp. Kp2 TaxID=1123518 RepID=UPI00041456A2|nr:helix-turn-helix transcriptional regulator [Thiomicrorhabdus sp. Kp2]